MTHARGCDTITWLVTSHESFFLCVQLEERTALGGASMAKKAGVRDRITLVCSECKQRNYNTKKNKQNTPEKLELKKFCRFCGKHTLHRETK